MALRLPKDDERPMIDFLASDASQLIGQFAEDLLGGDYTQVFDTLVEPINEGLGSNFDRQTSASGEAWEPHAGYTVWKMGPHPLLMWTGAMAFALQSRSAANRIEEITQTSLTIGTDLFYAPWQQYGTRRIPARPFVWLHGSYVDRVTEEFADGVMKKIRG